MPHLEQVEPHVAVGVAAVVGGGGRWRVAIEHDVGGRDVRGARREAHVLQEGAVQVALRTNVWTTDLRNRCLVCDTAFMLPQRTGME